MRLGARATVSFLWMPKPQVGCLESFSFYLASTSRLRLRLVKRWVVKRWVVKGWVVERWVVK